MNINLGSVADYIFTLSILHCYTRMRLSKCEYIIPCKPHW